MEQCSHSLVAGRKSKDGCGSSAEAQRKLFAAAIQQSICSSLWVVFIGPQELESKLEAFTGDFAKLKEEVQFQMNLITLF